MVPFKPEVILQTLNDEGVEYVVIGGLAAVIRGSEIPTRDVDVIPLRERANLDRLGRALTRLNARIRISGDPVATPIDGAFLEAMPLMLNLTTDAGDIDIAFAPAGPLIGYADWNANADSMPLSETLVIRVAALRDIIDSKRAANRPKDHVALPHLESLEDS